MSALLQLTKQLSLAEAFCLINGLFAILFFSRAQKISDEKKEVESLNNEILGDYNIVVKENGRLRRELKNFLPEDPNPTPPSAKNVVFVNFTKKAA